MISFESKLVILYDRDNQNRYKPIGVQLPKGNGTIKESHGREVQVLKATVKNEGFNLEEDCHIKAEIEEDKKNCLVIF